MNYGRLSDPIDLGLTKFSNDYSTIIVSCSGGGDSVALLHSISNICAKNTNLNLLICHINFGLRGKESANDEAIVVDLGKKLGITTKVLKVEKSSTIRKGEGTQEWARRVRRKESLQLAKLHNGIIATAHHQDDLAENILLRMSRGVAPSSVCGMDTFRLPWWKPWLSVSKSEIQSYLRRHNIPHSHDSSNDKLVYSRNKVRHQVLPVLESIVPGASRRLIECAQSMEEIARWSESFAVKPAEKIVDGKEVRSLSIEELINLPKSVAIGSIARLLHEDRKGHQLSQSLLGDLLAQCHKHHKNRKTCHLDTPGGKKLNYLKGILYVDHNQSS